MTDETPPPRKPAIIVKLGARTLTGADAVAALLVLLAGIVALVAWQAPRLRFTPLLASGIVWVAFVVYWSIAAADSARSSRGEPKGSRTLHQQLLNIGLLLLFVRLPGLAPRWVSAGPWPVAAGFALQLGSVALAVWARRHLGRNWSGEVARKEGHVLVGSGPYARLRHPIYTAMLGMYFGTALVAGELHGLLAFAIVGFAYARKIPLEEAMLRQEFGEQWHEYRATRWALIPGVY